MTSLDRTGRTAGALYLIVVVTGFFSLVYVPGHLNLAGDAQEVARNITADDSLYRLGILSWLVNQVAFVLLPLAFYRLFGAVHRDAAVAMVALVLVSVPISLVAAVDRLDALSAIASEPQLRAIAPQFRQALMLESLSAYRNAILIAQLFWGLWLLPLGYLVVKSGMVPKVLGVLLMLGCVGYLVEVAGDLLFMGYRATPLRWLVTLPGAVGEIGLCIWLLVRGARHASALPA